MNSTRDQVIGIPVPVFKKYFNQGWWQMSVNPPLGSLMQENHECEPSLGYIARPCFKKQNEIFILYWHSCTYLWGAIWLQCMYTISAMISVSSCHFRHLSFFVLRILKIVSPSYFEIYIKVVQGDRHWTKLGEADSLEVRIHKETVYQEAILKKWPHSPLKLTRQPQAV
jgi:hypothetical protein